MVQEVKPGTLNHGVLLRTRWMLEGYICNRVVTTYKVCTLAMDMEQIYAITMLATRG